MEGTATKKVSELSTGKAQPLTVGSTIPGLDKSLEGSRVGSRLLITIPPKDGFGSKGDSSLGVTGKDTLLLVVDVLGSYQKTASAHGTPEAVTGTGLPTVGTASAGTAPPVHIPKTAPSSKLQVQTLIQGTGSVVKKGQLLIAQYEGVIWRNGKVFSSTWKNGTPAGFEIGVGQVVKGWDDGLVGKRVGSQVLLGCHPPTATEIRFVNSRDQRHRHPGLRRRHPRHLLSPLFTTRRPSRHCGRSCGQSLPRFFAARMIWVTRYELTPSLSAISAGRRPCSL